MILGNYTQLNANVGKGVGGFTNPYQWMKVSDVMLFYGGDAEVAGETDKSSFNNGYTPPYSWVLAPKAGGLAAINGLIGYNSFTNINLAGALNAVSNVDGSGDISQANVSALAYLVASLNQSSTLTAGISGAIEMAATMISSGDLSGGLGALVSILADLNGNGEITANIAASLQAVATMAGSGNMTGSIAGAVQIVSSITGSSTLVSEIVGKWDMVASVEGAAVIAANVTAIADMISEASGVSTFTNVSNAIPGYMDVLISNQGDVLTADSVARAVWNSYLDSYIAGTAGADVNMIKKLSILKL